MIFQEPKTAAGYRTLALPPILVEELKAHLDKFVGDDDDALLFVDALTKETPSKTDWRTLWDRARRESGVECTFHDLRHVAGTLNAAVGATIKEAMARLGHASPEAALRYQHATTSRDSEIASDIDRLLRGTD
jgi:integrase